MATNGTTILNLPILTSVGSTAIWMEVVHDTGLPTGWVSKRVDFAGLMTGIGILPPITSPLDAEADRVVVLRNNGIAYSATVDDINTSSGTLPAGGTAGQFLVKNSSTNYDAGWSLVPISTGVSGLGAGVATFLATPSSANLAAAVTGETGTGALVFATSPTLVTPALGTPASGTLTNCIGLPISTGVSGLGANVAAFLSTPSSANLALAVTGETGTGALVFAAGPTLTTPILGTPTSGTLTNCTGLPILTGVAGLGAGVATFLETPSSANLASALTDKTGTGVAVFGTSPGFTTAITPVSNDGATLGTVALQWSDLFLASGGVINFASGDILISHSTNALTMTGGQLRVTDISTPLLVTRSDDAAAVQVLRLDGDRATPANNDSALMSFYLSDLAGTQSEVVRITARATDVTAGAVTSDVFWSLRSAGVITSKLTFSTALLGPTLNDGLALGSATVSWSDLFLASGGVINFNNGDVTITHSANTLTFAGASSGYSFDALLNISGAAAGQIQFPATQNASANANTLDDYEEGTFTPDIQFGGANVGMTYSAQSGVYVKIGRLVFVRCYFALTAKGSSVGTATVVGFPFAFNEIIGAPITAYGGMTGAGNPQASGSGGATTMTVYSGGTTGTTALTDTAFTNTSTFILAVVYRSQS